MRCSLVLAPLVIAGCINSTGSGPDGDPSSFGGLPGNNSSAAAESSSAHSGTSTSGGGSVIRSELTSGTRLKVRRLRGVDGSSMDVGFHDSELGIDCAFIATHLEGDNSGRVASQRRCLPVAAPLGGIGADVLRTAAHAVLQPTAEWSGSSYYSDSSCTQRIDNRSARYLLTFEYPADNVHDVAVFERGELAVSSGGQLFDDYFADCRSNIASADMYHYTPVPLTAFVAADVELAP